MSNRPAVAALRQEWEHLKGTASARALEGLGWFVERLLAALEAPPEPPDAIVMRTALEDMVTDNRAFRDPTSPLYRGSDWYAEHARIALSVRGEAGPLPPDVTGPGAPFAWARGFIVTYGGQSDKWGYVAARLAELLDVVGRGAVPPSPLGPDGEASSNGTSPNPLSQIAAMAVDLGPPDLSSTFRKGRGVVPAPPPEQSPQFQELLAAEHALSEAYLRLRRKLAPWGAFETPTAPTGPQVWAITELALDKCMRGFFPEVYKWPDDSMLEAAWGLIANANEGDWEKAHPEWREAAIRWRDAYHRILGVRAVPAPQEGPRA